MDPFHPFNNPANYGREHEALERPDPAVDPNDFLWRRDPQREYQDQLRMERMRREQTEHLHHSQHYGSGRVELPTRQETQSVVPGKSVGYSKAAIKRSMSDSRALVNQAQQMGQRTIQLLTAVAACPDIIATGRPAETIEVTVDMPRLDLEPRRRSSLWKNILGVTTQESEPLTQTQVRSVTVPPRPPIEGWTVGSRIAGPWSVEGTLRAEILGSAQDGATLYILPDNATSEGAGLFIGLNEPASVDQLKPYTYTASIGRLGMAVPGPTVVTNQYARERDSVELLRAELQNLLGKYGITDGLV